MTRSFCCLISGSPVKEGADSSITPEFDAPLWKSTFVFTVVWVVDTVRAAGLDTKLFVAGRGVDTGL